MKAKVYLALVALVVFAACGIDAFAQEAMVRGEVKRIDDGAGKITLNHGPIKNLDMPDENMTMVFHVQDPAMLKQVKVGDKVQFQAVRASAGITISKLQKAK